MSIFKRKPKAPAKPKKVHRPGDKAYVRYGFHWDLATYIGHNGKVRIFSIDEFTYGKHVAVVDDEYWAPVWIDE